MNEKQIQRRVGKKTMQWIIALVVTVCVLTGSYFLLTRTGMFTSNEGMTDTIIAVETTEDTVTTDKKLSNAAQNAEKQLRPDKNDHIIADNNNTDVRKVIKQKKDYNKPPVLKEEKDTTLSDQQNPGENAKDKSSQGVYKVISIAYFHNEPDEHTRRKAFVNHWNNAYASIKALDEKNGFIYVVYTNESGQTSKGWLRKKDLKEVKYH